ncbi:hypothetical protein OIU76_017542 [Salix suchowensis]|nr:hypothetical protein OIU76_017542 [Salix suchowensis]
MGKKPGSLSVSSVLRALRKNKNRSSQQWESDSWILRNGIDPDLSGQNATVDMFAKSELVDHALKVFERLKKRDGISWTVNTTRL